MAIRYWVSSGSWTATNTTNWSTSSGGSGGASVPTASDDVFFTGSSGNCTGSGYTGQCLTITFTGFANQFTVTNVQIAGTGTVFTGGSTAFFSSTFEITSTGSSDIFLTCDVSNNPPSFSFSGGTYALNLPSRALSLSFTGFSGLVNNSSVFIYGNLTASTGMTFGSGGNTWTFASTATQNITSNGKTLNFPVTVNGVSGTVRLLDNLTLGSTRALTLTSGTFNANNFNVTASSFSSSNSNTRTVTMGSGTWTLAGSGNAWNTATTTSLTLSANTSTINLTSASSKTFIGGGKTYYNLNQGGAGALTITSANTFNNITSSVQPATIVFPASATTTVSNFGLSGAINSPVTIQSSSAGTKFTLSKSSGAVNTQYLSIKDSAATGGATWLAQNSTNSGNNTGWVIIPAAGFFMALRK